METGEIIRDLRKKQGFTLKQLGEKVGVTEQAISQYERGLREPNDELLIKILRALNFDVDPYMKETVSLDPIWTITVKYITELLDYIERIKNIDKTDIKYVTVLEADYLLKQSKKYIESLFNKHKSEKEPDSPLAIEIKEVEEIVIETYDSEKFNSSDE